MTARDIESIGQGISRLQRLLGSRRVFSRLAAAASIELTQQATQVLLALDREGCSVAKLATAAHMDVGAVSRQLRVLEDARLALRRPSPVHGRIVIVRASASGAALAARVRSVRSRHLQDALRAWSAADRKQLAMLMNRLVTDLQAAPYRQEASGARGGT